VAFHTCSRLFPGMKRIEGTTVFRVTVTPILELRESRSRRPDGALQEGLRKRRRGGEVVWGLEVANEMPDGGGRAVW